MGMSYVYKVRGDILWGDVLWGRCPMREMSYGGMSGGYVRGEDALSPITVGLMYQEYI